MQCPLLVSVGICIYVYKLKHRYTHIYTKLKIEIFFFKDVPSHKVIDVTIGSSFLGLIFNICHYDCYLKKSFLITNHLRNQNYFQHLDKSIAILHHSINHHSLSLTMNLTFENPMHKSNTVVLCNSPSKTWLKILSYETHIWKLSSIFLFTHV